MGPYFCITIVTKEGLFTCSYLANKFHDVQLSWNFNMPSECIREEKNVEKSLNVKLSALKANSGLVCEEGEWSAA
jgi:hypothetical protein